MSTYRKDIQALRGFSIIMIIFYHLKCIYFKGGFIGVEVFNVISGYLLYEKTKNIKSIYCYIIKIIKGKIIRIIPTSHLVLLVLTLLYKSTYHNRINFLYEAYSSTLLYNNVWNYYKANDYFSQFIRPSLILHYWYLSLDIQFVIIFYFINNLTCYLYCLIEFLSFAYNIIYTYQDKISSYYLLQFRLWEFLFPTIIKAEFKHLSLLSYFPLLICSYIYNNSMDYPGFYSLIPVLCSSIIIKNTSSKYSLIIISCVLEFLGNISYPLYIIHYPIILYYNYSYISIYLVFILALLTHIIIENNIKKYANSKIVIFLCFFLIIILIITINIKIDNINFIFQENKYIMNIYKTYRYFHCNFCCYSEYSNIKFNKVFLFIGDSHILHFIPGFYRFSQLYRWKLIHKYIFVHDIIHNKYIDYYNIFNLKTKYDSIFTSFMYPHKMRNKEILYIQKFHHMLSKFTNVLIHIQDNPRLKTNPIDCYLSNEMKTCKSILNVNCSSPQYINMDDNLSFTSISLNFSKYYYSNKTCNYLYKNISIYADTNHLSYEFSLIAGHEIINRLKPFYILSRNEKNEDYINTNCSYFLTQHEKHYIYCKKKCLSI